MKVKPTAEFRDALKHVTPLVHRWSSKETANAIVAIAANRAPRGLANSPACHPELADPWRLLRIEYDWARHVAFASAMSDDALAANLAWGTRKPPCRYCRKFWKKYPGSKLDGHAKCIVTDHFKTQLQAFCRVNPQFNYKEIAQVLGVTDSVVRAWVAPMRRGK